MATVQSLHNATGYSLGALTRRKNALDLPKSFDAKLVLKLAEVGGDAPRLSLEEARTKETVLKSEKLALEISTLEKQRIPVDVVNDAVSSMAQAIRATIEASGLPDIDKQSIYEELQAVPERMIW